MKYYYEVVKGQTPLEFTVVGPLTNIYRAVSVTNVDIFAQVVDGKIVATFPKDEILVTTKPLVGHK